MSENVGDSMKSEDKRCRKTKKAIKTAVVELMTKKDIAHISITEISDLADINRKTFYAHYSNINDVLADIEDDLVETLSNLLMETGIGVEGGFDPMPFFEALTKLIEEDEFYRYLLEATYPGGFFMKIGRVLGDMIIEALRPFTDLDEDVLAEAVGFVSAGFLNAYRSWIRGGKKVPLEQVAKTAVQIANNGIHGLISSYPSGGSDQETARAPGDREET